MEITPDIIADWLQQLVQTPLLLGLALAIATFATEDGSLIAGSLLVGSGEADALLVITALATGIIVGDIGLYGLGWTARSNDFLRKKLPVKKSRPLRRWLQEREVPVLFASRFTPGTRLITYVTFGFLKLSLVRFIIVMTIAGVLWVAGMVLFISEIQQFFAQFGTLSSILAAFCVGVLVIISFPKLVRKLSGSKTLEDADKDLGRA